MKTQDLIKEATGLLEEHESAPSAVVLVMGYLHGSVSDKFVESVYECSEGLNDTMRNTMLEYLTDKELKDLIGYIIKISQES